MGKGRAPCCDKSKVKKGPWSPAEDLRLISFIQQHGHENWRALPKQAGLLRCGKSCRLRWINYLRPDVKRGNFTKEEEDIVINLHQTLGNKWSKIATYLPGRTDNEIKNVWNTHLKKRVAPKDEDSSGADKSKDSSAAISSSSSSSISKHEKRSTKNESDDHSQQWDTDHGNLTKKPRVFVERTKQLPSSSSSSSNYSNISNYSPVDISMPDGFGGGDEFDSLLMEDFPPPNFDRISILELELNNPKIQEISAAVAATEAEQPVEIPFESDVDFWNMLDGLNSSLPLEEDKINNNYNNNNNNNNNSNSYENCSDQSSNLGEIENRKWLRYIENELGLEEIAVENGEGDSAADKGFQLEMAPEKTPEVNSDIGYYHLWPSL